ncbi:hypothetical protein KR032_000728, partial [Drosophila birchii]
RPPARRPCDRAGKAMSRGSHASERHRLSTVLARCRLLHSGQAGGGGEGPYEDGQRASVRVPDATAARATRP